MCCTLHPAGRAALLRCRPVSGFSACPVESFLGAEAHAVYAHAANSRSAGDQAC
jgi:hypothetical protein